MAHAGEIKMNQSPQKSTRDLNHRINIKNDDKHSLISAIRPGVLIQVTGPPMVGKATLVDMALVEFDLISVPTITKTHRISCKDAISVNDVLTPVLIALDLKDTQIPSVHSVKNEMKHFLESNKHAHHIFVFYKCERLRTSGNDHEFLKFIADLVNFHWLENLSVTVILTSYKHFRISGSNTETIQVGMLTDPLDIMSILQYYAPGIDVKGYVSICQNILCLPEAARRLAEEYLTQEEYLALSPECLEDMVCNDLEFLSLIFHKRMMEVESWVNRENLNLILMYYPRIYSTFMEEHLKETYTSLHPTHSVQQWHQCLKRLKDNHVVRHSLEMDRLMFHPLVLYYCCSVAGLDSQVLDTSLKRNTKFICDVLTRAEETQAKHGRAGHVWGCLAQDWPMTRRLLDEVIRQNAQSYRSLLKAGIIARELIMINFPNEAKQFYSSLLESAKVHGTTRQKAVLEAILGHLSAKGTDIDYNTAEQRLDFALQTLSTQGPEFFYKWALRRKALIQVRRGRPIEAVEYYNKVKEEVNPIQMTPEDDVLNVSEPQELEELYIGTFCETFPLMYLGKTQEAHKTLLKLYEDMSEWNEHHQEFAFVLNNIGLTLERVTGKKDEALKWYMRANKESQFVSKISQLNFSISQNNIMRILYHQLDTNPELVAKYESELEEHLLMQQQTNGRNNWVAQRSSQLGEIKLRKQKYFEAFKLALEADGIVDDVTKDQDLRLKILLELAHYRIILGQQKARLHNSEPQFSPAYLHRSPEDYISLMVDNVINMKRLLCDEAHHNYLSACAHGVLLQFTKSRSEFEKYKSYYLQHLEENPNILKLVTTSAVKEQQQQILSRHRDFYAYILEKDYYSIDYALLVKYVVFACRLCQIIQKCYPEDMWSKELEDVVVHVHMPHAQHRVTEEEIHIIQTVINDSESEFSSTASPTCINVINQSETGSISAHSVVNPSIEDSSSSLLSIINKSEAENMSQAGNSDSTKATHFALAALNPSESGRNSYGSSEN